MSKAPWTPGPWRLHTQFPELVVSGPVGAGHTAIAEITSRNTADRALIAAAPEMAEVLECLACMARHFPTEKTFGTRPRSGAIYTVAHHEMGDAAITVEDLHRAAALLARIRGDAA